MLELSLYYKRITSIIIYSNSESIYLLALKIISLLLNRNIYGHTCLADQSPFWKARSITISATPPYSVEVSSWLHRRLKNKNLDLRSSILTVCFTLAFFNYIVLKSRKIAFIIDWLSQTSRAWSDKILGQESK